MTSTSVPEHVFISYAHEDKDFVEKIAADLEQAGIATWVDRTGLGPGSPNWEQTIRDAINRSFAVLLIASRNARQSNFVPDELTVARVCGRSVYPIWIAGEEWMDSVPIGMGRVQYIDCRSANYDTNLPKVIETLKKDIEDRAVKHFLLTDEDRFSLPRGYLSIQIDEQKAVGMRLGSYQSLRSLQDDLYMSYLRDRYRPYTYGKDWVIAGLPGRFSAIELLLIPLVPWSWLLERNRNQPLSRVNLAWANSSLETYGLVHGTYWQIIDLPTPAFGIATNTTGMEGILHDIKKNMYLKDFLNEVAFTYSGIYEKEDGSIKLVPSEEVNPNDYRYLYVLVPLHSQVKFDGKAFIVDRWWLFE